MSLMLLPKEATAQSQEGTIILGVAKIGLEIWVSRVQQNYSSKGFFEHC